MLQVTWMQIKYRPVGMCQAPDEATSGTRRVPPLQWLYMASNVLRDRQLCGHEIKAADVADGSN